MPTKIWHNHYSHRKKRNRSNTEDFFFFLLAQFPRSSTGFDDDFPLKVKMKAQLLKCQDCRFAVCSREKCQWLRKGIWERCQDDSILSPPDYEDITLIRLVIEMIATICLTYPINDSLMPVCGFLSSQLFFTDLNSFWRCFRAWEIIRNSLCPLLQLYHRSYWYCAPFLILQIPS